MSSAPPQELGLLAKLVLVCGRRDPFERADENSNTYWNWVISHAYLLYGMQAVVARQIQDFVKFPPRQKPAAFNLDEVLRQLQDAGGSANH